VVNLKGKKKNYKHPYALLTKKGFQIRLVLLLMKVAGQVPC